MRNWLAVLADQLQIYAHRWAALSDFQGVAFLGRLPSWCPAKHVHCADGGKFGHAPPVNDLHAQDIFKLLDDPLGTPGAADYHPLERGRARPRGAIMIDQAVHDGGNRARESNLFEFDHFGQAGGISDSRRA